MSIRTDHRSRLGLRVNEIFFSIQGESLYAGRPCVFVRLAGCNLRCTYCDTTYAYSEGRTMDVPQIISAVADYGFSLVEITGGEPLLQTGTPHLVDRLLDAGFEVMLETNGTLPVDRISEGCVRIMDIKCPGSGQSGKTDLDNLGRLEPGDQVKFVLCDREDYEFARQIVRDYWPPGRVVCPVLFSPVSGRLAPDRLAAWILADRLDVRLQLQLHKIIWPHIQRGV